MTLDVSCNDQKVGKVWRDMYRENKKYIQIVKKRKAYEVCKNQQNFIFEKSSLRLYSHKKPRWLE